MTYDPFPDPRISTPEGIVAYGGDLLPATLRAAYRKGIFPWPHQGMPLLWFCPPQRAVLEFAKMRIPRRLERIRRQARLRFTVDAAFPEVMDACRTALRPEQEGTWITPEMYAAYCRLHSDGDAHSVEAWDAGGNLVGGLYGVDAGGVFSGESMFHRAPNAGKLALLHFVEHLTSRGLDFIDIQQLTPHMEAMGAREIPRDEFLRRWRTNQAQGFQLFGKPPEPPLY